MTTSVAAYLPPVPRPPHDPESWLLDCRAGWHLGVVCGVEASPADGMLGLVPMPAGSRLLNESSGTLGGLVPPGNVAVAGDGTIFLLDRSRGLLRRFDACECRFDDVPCTGGLGEGARQLASPGGIAAACGNLYVCDTGHKRVLVFALPGFALRAVWSSPWAAELPQPWTPSAVAYAPGLGVLVADPANGSVHVFTAAGRWRRRLQGLGAVDSLAVDCGGRIVVRVPGLDTVSVLDPASGASVAQPARADELAACFPPLPFAVGAEGLLLLGSLCADADAAFDSTGEATTAPPPADAPAFPIDGTVITTALDSGLYRCQWDSVQLEGCFPTGTRVRVRTYTAETEEPLSLVAALPDDAWTDAATLEAGWDEDASWVPKAEPAPWDCLVRSAGGRFLWLQLKLEGDGACTPRLAAIRIRFPRISLRRYLPAVFGSEPLAADFTDRLLAVFDREFRRVEGVIDQQAQLFDPLSAPSGDGRARRDFLDWLASWIGVTLDRAWPEERRRRYLKAAGGLLAQRGTREGLRQQLLLHLGLTPEPPCCRALPPCGPCRVETPPAPAAPALVLEHYRLRRWLFLGAGRLGDQARLWGEAIVNRFRLGGAPEPGDARVGLSRLDSTDDPWRDPFHVYAHAFTVFAPARLARSAAARRSLERLVRSERPAHTAFQVVYVEPRFRIGVQSMIGYDSVVACWPECGRPGAPLGRGTLLPPGEDAPRSKVGSEARVGTSARLS